MPNICKRFIWRDKELSDSLGRYGFKSARRNPWIVNLGSNTARNNALKELEEIARALRCGVELDYSDSSQKKWFVVMIWDKGASGFRFDASYFEYAITNAIGDPRLCLDTQEKAIHFGTSPEIVKIWNRFLTKIVK